jgi:hypothetical protein
MRRAAQRFSQPDCAQIAGFAGFPRQFRGVVIGCQAVDEQCFGAHFNRVTG